MQLSVTEIASDIFRIGIAPDNGIGSIASFLIRDEQPALVQTNLGSSFDDTRAAVADLINPADLRYIFIPSFAMDECGALNHFLQIAPRAEPVCSPMGGIMLADFSNRPARIMHDDDEICLGAKTLRAILTPWVPLIDTMMLYDEADRLVFTADLFAQAWPDPVSEQDLTEAVLFSARLLGAFPSGAHVERAIERLEQLDIKTLACMHGSVLRGDPTRYYAALRENEVAGLVDVPIHLTGFAMSE